MCHFLVRLIELGALWERAGERAKGGGGAEAAKKQDFFLSLSFFCQNSQRIPLNYKASRRWCEQTKGEKEEEELLESRAKIKFHQPEFSRLRSEAAHKIKPRGKWQV